MDLLSWLSFDGSVSVFQGSKGSFLIHRVFFFFFLKNKVNDKISIEIKFENGSINN